MTENGRDGKGEISPGPGRTTDAAGTESPGGIAPRYIKWYISRLKTDEKATSRSLADLN
jgi:hypothetical protein